MEPLDIPKTARAIEQLGMRQWMIQEFTRAFREARKHKLKTHNEHHYEMNWQANILRLVDAVLEQYYRPSGSISFVIFDPMIREIFAAPFVDRIVHHFLNNMNGGWWDRRFIADSYSCRVGKGTLYGVKRIRKMMSQATKGFTKPAYIVKMDIRGYFMSLPREQLYARVKWGLERQFCPYFYSSAIYQLYHICCFLWRQILFDDPISKSRRRGPFFHWDVLPPEKSLYTRPQGRGIVIGNLTSQLVSNIYLDQLDHYIKYELGYKYYGRYVDDFIIIVPSEDYAKVKHDIKKIETFLRDELLLTLHPKKRYIQPVNKGVSFLGTRIYPNCYYPSNRLQKKFKAALYNTKTGKAQPETIISYFGFYQHYTADKYVEKLFKKYDLDYNLYLEAKSEKRRSLIKIAKDLQKNNKNT